jgi:hypothetical protein
MACRPFLAVSLLVLLLASCLDRSRAPQSPTGLDVSSLDPLQHLLGVSETQAGASARDAWNRLSPAQRAAAIRTIEDVYATRGEVYFRPQIAIATGMLPGRADALVIRDPATPGQPVIVVSRLTVNTSNLLLGQAALRVDGRRHPKPAVRRVLHVESDGWVTVSVERSPERWQIPVSSSSGSDPDVFGELTRSATSASTVHLREVGEATLLHFR